MAGLLSNPQAPAGPLLGEPQGGLLSGLSPVERKLYQHAIDTGILQPVTSRRQKLAEAGNLALGMLPGSGDVMAAQDSVSYGQQGWDALKSGRFMEAAQNYGNSVAAGLGVLPMVPYFGATIRAYHGSPHKFDKFSMDKIGTGEGAQAYGHGLYFAESPDVAKDYLRLAGPEQTKVGGRLIDEVNASDAAKDFVKQDTFLVQSGQRSIDDAIALHKQHAAYGGPNAAAHQEAADLLASGTERGHLYNVDLDVDPEDLLDWDAPLSQQPEKVRKILAESGAWDSAAKQIGIEPQEMTGAQFYSRNYFGTPSSGARGQVESDSKWLNGLGIKGIRYLDGTSRTAGEGTRNFVIFDDQLAKIVNE